LLPSASITQIFMPPLRLLTKAIFVPSGDHTGLSSKPNETVSWVTFVPSALIV
jgi:hypothetical protein